jgi:hypothetical protein
VHERTLRFEKILPLSGQGTVAEEFVSRKRIDPSATSGTYASSMAIAFWVRMFG